MIEIHSLEKSKLQKKKGKNNYQEVNFFFSKETYLHHSYDVV